MIARRRLFASRSLCSSLSVCFGRPGSGQRLTDIADVILKIKWRRILRIIWRMLAHAEPLQPFRSIPRSVRSGGDSDSPAEAGAFDLWARPGSASDRKRGLLPISSVHLAAEAAVNGQSGVVNRYGWWCARVRSLGVLFQLRGKRETAASDRPLISS